MEVIKRFVKAMDNYEIKVGKARMDFITMDALLKDEGTYFGCLSKSEAIAYLAKIKLKGASKNTTQTDFEQKISLDNYPGSFVYEWRMFEMDIETYEYGEHGFDEERVGEVIAHGAFDKASEEDVVLRLVVKAEGEHIVDLRLCKSFAEINKIIKF